MHIVYICICVSVCVLLCVCMCVNDHAQNTEPLFSEENSLENVCVKVKNYTSFAN